LTDALLRLPLLAAGPAPDVAGLLAATLPEILLTTGLLAILLLDCFLGARPKLYPRIAFVTVLVTLLPVVAGLFVPGRGEASPIDPGPIEGALASLGAALGQGDRVLGPLVIDDMARLFRILFLAAGAYTLLFGMRRSEDWFSQAEFHVLLLGSLAGMSLLSASADMLTAYLAFETVSYTGYLMVGYRKSDRASSEAGLKYVIFGAASSGALLFGITLLFGLAGSTSMEAVAQVLRETGPSPAAVAGAVLVFAGVAFKISAVPFHFWAPDAYSGSSTAVAGFLAVASKAAGFAVAIRVLGTWCGVADPVPPETAFGFLPPGPLPFWIAAAGAVATMVVGNAAALRQSELKRLLAWSSVAHAGYMLMAIATGRSDSYGAVLFYFWVYMLMTLGGFGIVGLLRGPLGGTELRHYRGLGSRNPTLAICIVILLVSLTGLPPTAGFWGKVLLFKPVIEAGYYGLAVVGLLASAVSLYYYALLMRAMFLEPPEKGSEAPVDLGTPDWVLVGVSTLPLLVGGLFGWWPAAAGFLNTAKEWAGAALR
jgi:proton-translocating NADH-quinone oxidoreductase chain N